MILQSLKRVKIKFLSVYFYDLWCMLEFILLHLIGLVKRQICCFLFYLEIDVCLRPAMSEKMEQHLCPHRWYCFCLSTRVTIWIVSHRTTATSSWLADHQLTLTRPPVFIVETQTRAVNYQLWHTTFFGLLSTDILIDNYCFRPTSFSWHVLP